MAMQNKTMKIVFNIVLTMGIMTMAWADSAKSKALSGLLPPDVYGFTPGEPDRFYTADTLYDLINGGAEVYRALNVRQVVHRRYGKEGAPEIFTDIFDMGSSSDAFGAYHHDMREGKDAGVGQESEYFGGSLAFWKDRYFVSIVPLQETAEVKRAVMALGKAIAHAIPREGAKPELVRRLPAGGLITSQVHYFHDWGSLNRRYFLAPENLLNLDERTEGILARYRSGRTAEEAEAAGSCVLVLIRYPSRRDAEKAHGRFLEKYMPDADAEGLVQTEDGQWTGLRLMDDVLAVVFDTSSGKEARTLLHDIQKTWSR